MSEPDPLVAQRLGKCQALRDQGLDPYANDARPSHDIAAFIAAFADQPTPPAEQNCCLVGRVMAANSFGKAAFLRLADGSGGERLARMQIYLRAGELPAAAQQALALLDLGDFVAATGHPMRTRTGELTLAARDLRVIGKALRPLPEKWHGLADVEKRHRARYLDLISNEEVRRVFVLRARLVALLRAYLDEQGFVEVETPTMHPIVGGATARPFVTHHQALDIPLYLRVAPELYLKRLLVGGLPRVFEIGRNFRNEGMSPLHSPEFTMLEFYQAFADADAMMAHTEAIFDRLAASVLGDARQVTWQGHAVNLRPPYRRLRMVDAVAEATGVAAEELAGLAAVQALCRQRGLVVEGAWGAHLAALFEHLAEPGLVQPTFVTDFPAEVSPLARRAADGSVWVDRFELYAGGRELANAFSELNDPIDQRARFAAQGGEVDEDYLRALEHGMPPAGGCGIGIDRLVMLMTEQDSIREVVLFPLMRPER